VDSPTDLLIPFYQGHGPDIRGRMLRDIHAWDYGRLESTHDYIQWLFPLANASAFNPEAPLLGPQEIARFHSDATLRRQVIASLQLMLGFYGLVCDEEAKPVRIFEGPNFSQRAPAWLTPGNHNFLRLTRILKSLMLLGLEEHALALFACLEKLYEKESAIIGARTFGYWRKAVTD
jgi:hypothetical protein